LYVLFIIAALVKSIETEINLSRRRRISPISLDGVKGDYTRLSLFYIFS